MKFLRDLEDGFVLIMSLIILPVFLGFGLILIDVGRGNNAHADLQTVVDALALTGARELDGSSNAMTNARNAMTELRNPVSMLTVSGSTTQAVTYSVGDTRFEVVFLTDIPASDDTPITAAWKAANAASTGSEANYIYVRAFDRNSFALDLIFDVLSFFQSGSNPVPGSLPIGAYAVARSDSNICDIPPLFMCNPFEYVGGIYDPDEIQERFNAGDLHGRMIRLHPGGGSTAFPGNFGFLQVAGNPSADDIRDFFAGGSVPACFDDATIDTAPGAMTSVAQGINVRFDVLPQNYGNQPLGYYPQIAENVRKGHTPPTTGGNADCTPTSAHAWGDDHIFNPDNPSNWTDTTLGENGDDDGVYGFPDNDVMAHPQTKTGTTGTPGAYVGTNSDWNLQRYLDVNYGVGTYSETTLSTSITSFAGRLASRYDVYRWEIATGNSLLNARSPGPTPPNDGEVGLPNCSAGGGLQSITSIDPTADPRVLPLAVVDCGELQSNITGGGSLSDVVVNTYVSVFLTRPMENWFPSGERTIDVEVIDIAGYGGNGTLETFVRDEAVLVR
ncbi:TadE/TadG family type IV pilus assembly protein [Alisedimentitalea sp. MJ-SS2]|uniref:TadE/TadG family type IV pilus assembly protein n=1 Tax=Aliisedimentitalea sp. MJ-SS2 TaxID=3049795 RepID=UPI00290B5246|nr:TadE/TadG family type IV pilus assembly protein [Alisedimentitalea sp. MJ-SS2]MDU8928280.1 TadE/TadG family type IV pilus assembly protein [Alisedimentitalea sp. MJ-SS2]